MGYQNPNRLPPDWLRNTPSESLFFTRQLDAIAAQEVGRAEAEFTQKLTNVTFASYGDTFTISKAEFMEAKRLVTHPHDVRLQGSVRSFEINVAGTWREYAMHGCEWSGDRWGDHVAFKGTFRIVFPPSSPGPAVRPDPRWFPQEIVLTQSDLRAGRLREVSTLKLTLSDIDIIQRIGRDEVSGSTSMSLDVLDSLCDQARLAIKNQEASDKYAAEHERFIKALDRKSDEAVKLQRDLADMQRQRDLRVNEIRELTATVNSMKVKAGNAVKALT